MKNLFKTTFRIFIGIFLAILVSMNVWGQETATIGTGTSTNYYPMPGFWGYQYDVYLYTPSAASFLNNACTISSIAWQISSGSTNSAQMTIWIKDVDASTTLNSSTTFSSFTSGATQVYSGSRTTSTGWNTYSFSSSFSHQAGKALLVAVRGVGCSSSGGCSRNCYYTSASSTHWYKHSDSSDPGTNVTGTIDGNRSNVQIKYTVGASGYNMHTGSITTCSGTLYDSGGASGSYDNNEDRTLTIYPGTLGNMVRLDFMSFEIETCCDHFYIYNGTSTSATQIGSYSSSPGTVTATNSSGALTIRFTSDVSIVKTGWAATISCVAPQIYTVTYNANGGSGTMEPQTFTDGEEQALTLNTFINPGYEFIGWNTSANGSGIPYSDGEPIIIDSDVTLYAQWREISTDDCITIGNGTSTTYYGPYNSLWGYSFVEQIYPASEIGRPGTINSIAFNMSSTDVQTNNIIVYIKHTAKSSFADNTD